MRKKSVLKASALAVAVAASAAPMAALAEISGSLAITSQYLWRGQQLSSGPTVNGSLDYGHESGFYAGIWTSSEVGDTEYDLYAGFAGEAGGLSYDIAYVDYNYTSGGTADLTGLTPPVEASQYDFEEVYVGLGMGGLALDAYIGVGDYGHPSSGGGTDNNDNYVSLSYSYDNFGVLVGAYMYDGDPENPGKDPKASNLPDYQHLDLSYALTDQFTFTASKIIGQEDVNKVDIWDDDLLFSVAYSFEL